ncbi:MAG TPA: cbb3-type cytochrome oxidase assembly protein CcoS, partial [Chitinophagaceae bacterium]|nr:cbb3-type cytochrome oxidase assembly protein CcoS [Chitinophagaceae bacterium]
LRKPLIKISIFIDKHYSIKNDQKILLPQLKIDRMSVIIILLIASISIAGLFLVAFLWGVKSGQFEDDYSPSSRILFDDKPSSSNQPNK